MAEREIDEQLAMLCHMELAGGAESLAETVADLPRSELERLLCLAVVEVMDARTEADRRIARMAERLRSSTRR